MSRYKLVDADKLDVDLSAIADAIREKTGKTDPIQNAIAFPDGFIEEIGGIPDYKDTLYSFVDGSITEFVNDEITELVDVGAFCQRRKLVTLSMPNLVIGKGMMCMNCNSLVNIHLPLMTNAGNNAFQAIAATTVDFPSLRIVYSGMFQSSPNLTALILRCADGVTLSSVNAFTKTPIEAGTGYVYVPSALVDSYKTATNWSAYADQIRAIEDYPEITGGATA